MTTEAHLQWISLIALVSKYIIGPSSTTDFFFLLVNSLPTTMLRHGPDRSWRKTVNSGRTILTARSQKGILF